MKAVILAGGRGTRISEESHLRPKPMIEIGGRPILWHIMKIYSHHGIDEFVICLGYKGYFIKEYFLNYVLHASDTTVNLAKNEIQYHGSPAENWRIHLIDTGEDTATGGRLKRIAHIVRDESAFCMTYGDGLSDIDIRRSIEFHRGHGKMATLAAVRPPGRFGAIALDGDRVAQFIEKPLGDSTYINGGFFVLAPAVLNHIRGDDDVWERDQLPPLALQDEMRAFRHDGFWQPMDTLRDRDNLESLWASSSPPWKCW